MASLRHFVTACHKKPLSGKEIIMGENALSVVSSLASSVAVPDSIALEPRPEEMVQGSREWHESRMGCVTSSNVAKAVSRAKGKLTQTALTYMYELLGERMTGIPSAEINSKYLEWGKKHEPTARALYTWRIGQPVVLTGFVPHESWKWFGGSPDGLVGTDGIMEIKCPYTCRNHVAWMDANEIDDRDYRYQIQNNLFVTGRQWCDFVTFHPWMPDKYQMHIIRIERDEAIVKEIAKGVEEFLTFAEAIMERIDRHALESAKRFSL
jgi:putative phage-type endonuclease